MLINLKKNISYYDIAEPWQIGFQDPATPIMEGIINFHHDLFFFLIIITLFVCWFLLRIIITFNENKNKISLNFVHGTFIEIIWTIIPALILLFIAIPSFALLYSMDEIIDPFITIKIIGNQWYWSYEYSDSILYNQTPERLQFDSYMIQDNDLEKGQFRLLEVDNRVIIPIKCHVRILITASDVLHSWAVPSLGIKLDSCPGRLNQTTLFIKRTGVFYGQCSELCGINHGFMPIVIDAVSLEDFNRWLFYRVEYGGWDIPARKVGWLNTTEFLNERIAKRERVYYPQNFDILGFIEKNKDMFGYTEMLKDDSVVTKENIKAYIIKNKDRLGYSNLFEND